MDLNIIYPNKVINNFLLAIYVPSAWQNRPIQYYGFLNNIYVIISVFDTS